MAVRWPDCMRFLEVHAYKCWLVNGTFNPTQQISQVHAGKSSYKTFDRGQALKKNGQTVCLSHSKPANQASLLLAIVRSFLLVQEAITLTKASQV